MSNLPETIIRSRLQGAVCPPLYQAGDPSVLPGRNQEAEGGCGVIGLASSVPLKGKYLIEPCGQMRNRGNGKGGGVAIAGCFPQYPRHYAVQVGYLEIESRSEIEAKYIFPNFDVAEVEEQPSSDDYRQWGLEIEPPKVVRYFARVKERVLQKFAQQHGFSDLQAAEDEFVFQNSFRLNSEYYGDREDKKAFVLSHGRNMMILKAVGYAEDIARYYLLDDFEAYVWIGHQRYPTRGRVWHPGGAHPFSGLDEALVHNGDFANYYGVSEYLRQRNYYPLFMTDTEVSVYLFDLYNRVYGYPLEYIIEALAPTAERDLTKLPPEKQEIYRAIQRAHLHGSPDGPWFFIIARNDVRTNSFQLIGITDTSMLRPQVFALQQGEVSIGAIASEKQAIDAFLKSLANDDPRVCPIADSYWNARGGSYSDGGAFVFNVGPVDEGDIQAGHRRNLPLQCTDKFGKLVTLRKDQTHRDIVPIVGGQASEHEQNQLVHLPDFGSKKIGGVPFSLLDFDSIVMGNGHPALSQWSFAELERFISDLVELASRNPDFRTRVISLLTQLNDRRYDTGAKKRSAVIAQIRAGLDDIFRTVTPIGAKSTAENRLIGWKDRHQLTPPSGSSHASPEPTPLSNSTGLKPSTSSTPSTADPTLFIDCSGFEPQGPNSAARLLVEAYRLGWKRFVVFGCRGDRFIGCGLGPGSQGVRIDVYGSSGDYLGSGLDGAEIHVHGDAQDQVGQIMKSGKLVIHGMVGQTFLYGAKGGVVYVLGNAAGRPLINAVGNIRAIINGTALDYAAESFMAGATTGGGFLILNGITFDERGRMVALPDRYPGSNFFSLASGGAGYVNDPDRTISVDQLNGGEIVEFTSEDWEVISPFLKENEAHFGIKLSELLQDREPQEVYCKVVPERTGSAKKMDAHT
ncbi:MAG: glutamate synthase [Chloroflexota bacterium]|jgi:glutamate synthase domain-containing protein 1/glutamate synthase domain-containing protein 3